MNTNESGFIAIISVTIIAALLMAVSFALSTSGFFARSDIADGEYKERSMALAEACAQDALVKLAADGSYTGNETMAIGTQQCSILPITASGGQKTVKTTAVVQGATTNILVKADATTLTIVSWEQTPN